MKGLEQGQPIASRYLASFQFPEFRRLWTATICSQSSIWALIIARGSLAKDITGSDLWTGLVTFAAMLPWMIVSPIGGYIADRFDRRKVLLWAYWVNLGHNILLAFLAVSGAIEVWHLVALALFNGTVRAAQLPAAQALLPNTVDRERIVNAVSLYQATQQGSRFVGGILVAVTLWATGPWLSDNENWVFFVGVGLYAVGLSMILRMHTTSRGEVEAGTGLRVAMRNLTAGFSYMYHHPLVFSLIVLVVAHCALTMSFESLLPALSEDKLGLTGAGGMLAGSSYLLAAFGAAALVTALGLAGVRSERYRGQLFLWTGVLSGLASVAMAVSPNAPPAILAAALMGAAQGGFMTLGQAMIQTIVPDAIRGRLMGVYIWHILGFMAGFNLVNGGLVSIDGVTASLVLGVGGVVFMGAMVVSFARITLRQLYSGGVPAALSPA